MSCKGETLVSIIIPVFNVEKYLPKCLESIINQTLKDIEIICVNDSSSDGSLEILNEYAFKDSRIKIINLEQNQGQGFARNKGIELATGEYIGFVDSDDYIDLDYFEKLYNTAKKNNCDIAVASILKHKKNYKKYNVQYKKEEIAHNIQEKIRLCNDKTSRFFYAWNKIYKTDLIKNTDIKFSEGQIYEDVIFAIKALYYSNSVVSVPDTEYHYIERKNSTVKKKQQDNKKDFDHINAYIELQRFCKVNNISLPERLNYYTTQWYNPYVKTYIGQYFAKDLLFGFIPLSKKKINYDFPIDLVYLWVDGNDPEWKKKKEYWQEQYGMKIDKQAIDDGRFIDNEELRFSLRSTEKYAPWINKIYIVTDNQIPKWLDTNNPKIEVIFHKDFIPQENLPLFNSEAIETYLPYIPNLSEHFLYANDDMFFGDYVGKHFFFDANNKTIVRLKHQVSKKYIKTSMYTRKILNMQEKVRRKFKKSILFAPHHNIDAYKKSDFLDCIELFKDEIIETGRHKFRTEGDIQRSLFTNVALAQKKSHLKLYSRIDRFLSPLNRIKNFISRNVQTDSIVINSDDTNYIEKLAKYNPKLFCINDDEKGTKESRLAISKFLNILYPNKSYFEKEESLCQM